MEKLRWFQGKIKPVNNRNYIKAVSDLVEHANFDVDICQYHWKWASHSGQAEYQQFYLKVLSAVRRNIKVRVLLNVEAAGNHLTKINAKTKKTLSDAGADVKFSPTHPRVHAKFLIIDRIYTVVGSHNFSKQSFTSNDETSVIIKSKKLAMYFRKYFELLYNRY